MLKSHPFTIYNASAGSGKTFTLVKDYLKIILQSNNKLAFRNILALTFTNKAVGEMKERIIDTLKQFSSPDIILHPHSMFTMICEELKMKPEVLHNKSKTILETMVHNYAAFDISTIDKFNHKLIRTFAHDLKLPINFEVELDALNVLSKAVDQLIDKAGINKELTKVLVDFALEKADDGKSWDIAFDFNAVAKLLINENEIPYIETIKDKTLKDFKQLKSNLIHKINSCETQTSKKAKELLVLIDECGLQHDDFSGSYLPKHFQKLAASNFAVGFEANWQVDLDTKALYPKRVTDAIASIINEIQSEIAIAFIETKTLVLQYKFYKNCLQNLSPLSVLNAISSTLKDIKEEENLILISEFNSIISNEIHQQPAPFIYERIGEKFKHYFIDEFQDTSKLQWENLMPLIDNALSSETLEGKTGSVMIVGDAKQAIYRWRGGKAEQFIQLYTKADRPFVFEQDIKNLPVNYRSSKSIIKFNNAFFLHLSSIAFKDESHQNIYRESKQDAFLNHEGYVELSFLELDNSDKNTLHGTRVLEIIQKAKANGFDFSDICIITRKTKESIAIAEQLSANNIPIVSSETLQLQNSPEVRFISNIINLATQPKNSDYKIEVLNYLAEHQLQLDDKHQFYQDFVSLETAKMFDGLERFDLKFDFNSFLHLPLYDAVETIIRAFYLNKHSNAYLQFYLDEILEYSHKHSASFLGFSTYWNLKKDKLNIVSPEGKGRVKIMTIHKSKGLEFPVVIFPFANQDIYFDLMPKVWFPVNPDDYSGFSHLYINLNKDLAGFNEQAAEIYHTYQSQLELDHLNLLYVVLTRAVDQLYIISEYDLDKKQNEKLKLYSGLFINYLKSIQVWNNDQYIYSFGNSKKESERVVFETTTTQQQFISTSKEAHDLNILTNSGFLWDTAQEKAIEKGNLVHQIMAFVKTENDIELIFNQFTLSGKLNASQVSELKPIIQAIVNHEKLSTYFESDKTIYNEKDIIAKNGRILRPDRVVINSRNEAVIIDYKTGLGNTKYKEQLQDYQDVLEDMGFIVNKKILVYVNDGIDIKEV